MRRTAVLLAVLVLMASGTQVSAVDIFPTVALDFDPATFTYTYTIMYPDNATSPFGYFQVDTMLAWAADWSTSGPWVPDRATGADQAWFSDFATYQVSPKYDFAYWRASQLQEVMPGAAWTGDFILIVPNSMPVPGWVMTKDGVGVGENPIWLQVPGPIPEPGSLAALGFGLAGLVGFCSRRRRPR